MSEINVEHNISLAKLDTLGVDVWPVWTKEVATFDWTYDQTEVCYVLEGEAIVTPKQGNAVTIKEGDYVVFPKGLSCTWEVKTPFRKHYNFK